MEIAPKEVSSSPEEDPSVNMNFRMVFTGVCTIGRAYYHVNVVGTDYSGSGNFDIEKLNTDGRYEFNISFIDDSGHAVVGIYTLKIYYGGFLIDSSSGAQSQIFGGGYTSCIYPPITFFRGITLSVSQDCAVDKPFVIGADLDNNICQDGERWDTSSVLSATLTGPAVFLNTETKEITGEISMPYQEYRGTADKYIILSTIPYYAEPGTATLIAGLGTKVQSFEINVAPQNLFTFTGEFCYGEVGMEQFRYCGYEDNFIKWFPINLSVISGSEYVSFYDYSTGETQGDNLLIPPVDENSYNILQQYYLKIDNYDPPEDTVPVVVEYQVMGNTQSDTSLIVPPAEPSMYVSSGYTISHNDQGYLFSILEREGCYYPFPDTTSFKFTTVYGSQYGELVDEYGSGISGDILDLSIRDGCCLSLWYHSNGEETLSGDSVVIKVESSMPGIEPGYVLFYITPQLVKVTVTPDVLSPGDTAVVVINKWDNESHAYQPINSEEYFEVGLEEGCADGILLLSDGREGNFFTEIRGVGVKFVAADSLESDSAVVKIRGGIWGEQASIAVNGEEVKDKIKNKADVETKRKNGLFARIDELNIPRKIKERLKQNLNSMNKLTPSGSPGAVCPVNNYDAELNDKKELIILKGCGFVRSQHSEITYNIVDQNEFYKVLTSDEENPLMVFLNVQVCNQLDQNGFSDWEQNGGSIPADYRRFRYDYNSNQFIKSWDLMPYKEKDNVHYYFVNPETETPVPLLFDYVMGICYNKMNVFATRPGGYVYINSLSDVSDINKIGVGNTDAEQAFADFCGFNCYPNEIYKYQLIEEIQTHEREHKEDFVGIIEKRFPDLVKYIYDNTIKCSRFNEKKLNEVELEILKIVTKFIGSVSNELAELGGISDPAKKLLHEREIQARPSIQNLILDYIAELAKRFPQFKNKKCSICKP